MNKAQKLRSLCESKIDWKKVIEIEHVSDSGVEVILNFLLGAPIEGPDEEAASFTLLYEHDLSDYKVLYATLQSTGAEYQPSKELCKQLEALMDTSYDHTLETLADKAIEKWQRDY